MCIQMYILAHPGVGIAEGLWCYLLFVADQRQRLPRSTRSSQRIERSVRSRHRWARMGESKWADVHAEGQTRAPGMCRVSAQKPFCTAVLSAVHPRPALPPPSFAWSIRWYDPMNVQWSPMRPLFWTVDCWPWWCSCGNVPFELLSLFHIGLFSITA